MHEDQIRGGHDRESWVSGRAGRTMLVVGACLAAALLIPRLADAAAGRGAEETQRPDVRWACTHPGRPVWGADRRPRAQGLIAPFRAGGCRVVVSYYSHPRWGGVPGHVWVYSDGRVLTARDGGWYDERRLTPAAVRAVRSKARTYLGAEYIRSPAIRIGDRVLPVRDPVGLADVLLDLSWLGDASWVSARPRPYAAELVLACWGARDEADASVVLASLPEPARRVLGSKNVFRPEPGGLGGLLDADLVGQRCAVLARNEDRTLRRTLHEAGMAVTAGPSRRTVFHLAGAGGRVVWVSAQPLLPHGW